MNLKALILSVALTAYLGSHNGQLALFHEGHERPVKTYPLSIVMLPVSDQKALTNGIPIRNNLQLAQLLEDFLS